MSNLIHDVQPPSTYTRNLHKNVDSNYLLHVEKEALIVELYMRGVTIERIFAQYYAMEEMGAAGRRQKPLTVGDAELAGLTAPTSNRAF